jgi:hypothetical protein
MLILVGVTINVGTGSIEESRRVSFVTYMQTIQTKVDFIIEYDEYDEYKNYGQELSETNKNKLQNILNNDTENLLTTVGSKTLRYFDSTDIADDLEIENIDDEIVVDFNTREVISLIGIEYEDKMYYTQYNLPGGQVLKEQTEDITRNVSFGDVISNIDGLNATFTISNIGITNGTLSCGRIIDDTNVYKTVIVSPSDSMPTLLKFGYYITKGRKVSVPKKSEDYLYWNDFMQKGKHYKEKVLAKTTSSQPAVILHSGGTT